MADASPIAAWVWRDRYRIAGQLLAMHAVAPGHAVAFKPQTPKEATEFERMLAHRIVREAGRGQYWLDWPAYNAETEARRAKMVVPVIAVAVMIALLLTLFYRRA